MQTGNFIHTKLILKTLKNGCKSVTGNFIEIKKIDMVIVETDPQRIFWQLTTLIGADGVGWQIFHEPLNGI